MLRAARLYYHGDLTQDAIGKRLGVSRFKVGRLLDRALTEQAVRIEIVHPAARLVALEDALVARFGLTAAVVVDVPATGEPRTTSDWPASAWPRPRPTTSPRSRPPASSASRGGAP